MSSLSYYIKNPLSLGLRILLMCAKYLQNDKLFLQLRYWFTFGKWLDLKDPQTFNEKLQWLKLYNRKPEYTMMVDKYGVKEYVANKIGHEFIIPTLGVWEKPEDIPFDKLPNQFVLKTTHGGGGGGVIICKDKSTFNIPEAVAKLKRAMKSDIYTFFREWPYKNVARRIIAEKFMLDENGYELKDYKLYCFDGNPKLCQLITDRRSDEKIDFYDMSWKKVNGLAGLNPKANNSDKSHNCPVTFEQMKVISCKLSENIPFARVDMYEINGRCYFGEITFFPAGGFGYFRPNEWNYKIGAMINISQDNNKMQTK